MLVSSRTADEIVNVLVGQCAATDQITGRLSDDAFLLALRLNGRKRMRQENVTVNTEQETEHGTHVVETITRMMASARQTSIRRSRMRKSQKLQNFMASTGDNLTH